MQRQMTMLRHALLLACALSLVAVPACSGKKGDVVVLTDANFDTLTEDGVWMIDIFAPW